MADAVMKAATKAVARPPMANGPIPKPEMRRGLLKYIRFWSYPAIGLAVTGYVATYFFMYERHRKKYENYWKNLDPDKLYEEIREYGVMKGVKASWQE